MSKSQLYYVEKEKYCVLSHSSDPSIASYLKQVDAELRKVRGKLYWFLSHEAFRESLSFLKTVGYCEFQRDQQSAYRIAPQNSSSTAMSSKGSADSAASVSVGQTGLDEPTLSIKDLNLAIDLSLKGSFPSSFWIRGEVSDCKGKSTSHLYFDLIEPDASQKVRAKMPVIIFVNRWARIKELIASGELPALKNGDEIRVRGKLNFYSPYGKVSFSIDEIDARFAEGEFFKKKAQIEAKLEKMGLLERNRALPRPFLPLRLAVFSNKSAAGFGDFIRILEDSAYPFVVTVFSVALQGKELEPSFVSAFKMLNSYGASEFDYGIVIRGGGGVAELADFNNLLVAEAIALSPLKFLIGIGHEKDRTVLDEIAERAATPTDVAKILVERVKDIDVKLDKLVRELSTLASAKMRESESQFNSLCNRCLRVIGERREAKQYQIDHYTRKLLELSQARLHEQAMGLERLRSELKRLSGKQVDATGFLLGAYSKALKAQSETHLNLRGSEIEAIFAKLCHISEKVVTAANNDLEILRQRFELLEPKRSFERGFVLLQDLDGRRVSEVSELSQDQGLRAFLLDGKLLLHITEIEKDEARDEDQS